MFPESPGTHPLDRRTFLKAAGTIGAGAIVLPHLGCMTGDAPLVGATGAAARPVFAVRPFALTEVALGESLFRQKRDRMLGYALGYGGTEDPFAGPDRLLSVFRANAGLDTRGAEPPGSWEDATGYLRGHYAGHFMSMLAQAYAGTGDEIYRRKLDYMVDGLAECQAALAEAAGLATPRVSGPHGSALRLSGSPLGHAEHVRLPAGLLDGLADFTVATWIELHEYAREDLPDSNRNLGPSELNNDAAVFDFGSPSPEYAEPALARMFLTVRASNDAPVPRFAITTSGEEGEQRLDGTAPLPVGQWVHLAVTRSGTTGTLWVNGEPVATHDAMTLGPADLGATTDNWIGRRQFPQRTVSYLNAALAEFQVWGRALSGDEVRSLMDAAGGSAGGGDVAWYRFAEEAGGPTARDDSGRGVDATIVAPTDGRRHPGFLSAYPETQFLRLEEFATYGSNQGIWAPYYTLHKIMAGLIDAHELAGNERALEILTGIGDWAHARLEPLRQEQLDRMWDIYIAGEYGGINESLARLHALRPDRPEYLAAARRFDNTAVLRPTAADEDILDGRHANQHIPQFTGYLRIYEQGAGDDYHAAARHFWDMVVPHRIYGHGGMGVGEMFRERGVIAGSLFDDENHAETCPLYNLLKLSRALFFHDPDPKYMSYYELGIHNQILGSRRDVDSVDSPEVTYFVPVRPGERRSYGNTGTCCGGTGMENHTKFQDSIYFRSADGSTLYVNLYIPSTLTWQERGITVRQESAYPAEGSSTLTVDGRGALDIRLRVPVWAREGFTVRVNGEAQELDAVPGTYVSVSRTWSAGDTIEIEMPFGIRTERALDDPTVQSIHFGPTLLAVQGEPVGEALETGLVEVSLYRHVRLDGHLALAPAERPLHFTLDGRTLAPFHVADPQSSEPHPYHIYVRRREPRIVFGSVDAGVDNRARADGLTLLDVVWDQAPFASHADLVAAVERVSEEWRAAGLLEQNERDAVVSAAGRAEEALRV